MSISSFVKSNYTTINAYEGINIARHSNSIEKGIVVLDEDEPIGVLTSGDLARKQHQIIIDCLSAKPTVKKTDKIADVLEQMERSGNSILMVYDTNKFVGTISQSDILHHLHTSFKRQKLTLQSAAHDLKSPMASIKMISDMLQSSLKLAANKELVDYLNQSCDFAQKIIEDILITEQSIEESVTFTDEDFDELLDECISSFSKELEEKHISLLKDLQFGRTVMLDRQKFKRAIHNLLSNSIKFTHPGGRIDISTTLLNHKLKLVIKDNGIGIPKEIQEQIFDKFTKAKRAGTAGEPTTGLGMYLTKQIVELHDGIIGLESDGKTGTSFTILLNLIH